MTAAPAYARVFGFADWTANHPSDQPPGVRIDAELDNAALSINAVNANLALLQRTDGRLVNASVGPDQITADLTIGLRSVGDWATAHAYIVNDAVWTSGKLYRCLLAHTSTASFAADLALLKWSLVYDFTLAIQSVVNAAIAAGLLTVGVDTSTFAGKGSANVFTSTNTFQALTTFSAMPITALGTATSALTYATWKPTDYGAGKPALLLKKLAGAAAWAFAIDDGIGGTGTLDLPAATTIGGATIPDNTTLLTKIRRARNAGLTSR